MISSRRNTALIACWLLFGTLAVCDANALDSVQEARAKYDALKAKVESGNLEVDWQALRLNAAVAGIEGTYDGRKANAEGVRAFNAKDYDKALAKGQEIVSHNIANGDGHFLLMVSYSRLGKQQESEREKTVVDKILQSILDSCNGQTPATAWFTVTPSEEYFVFRLVGMSPNSQELVTQDGHTFDKMVVTQRDGKEATFWFNTDTAAELAKRDSQEK